MHSCLLCTILSLLLTDTWGRCRACRWVRSEKLKSSIERKVKPHPPALSLRRPCWNTATAVSPNQQTTPCLAETACRDRTYRPLQVDELTVLCRQSNGFRLSETGLLYVQASWGRTQWAAAAVDLRTKLWKVWRSLQDTAAWWAENLSSQNQRSAALLWNSGLQVTAVFHVVDFSCRTFL